MKKIKDLKFSSQQKLYDFACSWWGTTERVSFDEQDINEEIGMTTSSYRPSYFLHHAIEIDDSALVEDLCKNNANVNQTDYGYGGKTPLQLASDLGRSTIVAILLDYGAITENVKVNYTINPYQQPMTFMWSMLEWTQNRTVDYAGVSALLKDKDKPKGP